MKRSSAELPNPPFHRMPGFAPATAERHNVSRKEDVVRSLFAGLLFTLLSVSPLAAELPDAPTGFRWQVVPEIEGAILVPKGWHYASKTDGGTVACFVTQTALDLVAADPNFSTGLTLNAFFGNDSAGSQLIELIRATASKYSGAVTEGGFGPFVTVSHTYDLDESVDRPVTRVFHMAIVNIEGSAGYYVIFESPLSEWDQAWKKGRVMVTTLGLSGRR